ncbi:DNA primase [Streptomyces sp. NPDC047000]|uniref:DNA primase n=1 Tax=Streptomyces sp. NPDC047000 TaxID=3155474 RepID=UPI0033E5DC79
MNRTALGLAIGAGYLLGRTKKMKLAIAAGSLVAGKRLNLSPGAVTELITRQLKDNPQFKEIGGELRNDLRGVGKAASGALVERQIAALADRLHDRTAGVRGRLSGEVPGTGKDADTQEEEPDTGEDQDTGGGAGTGRTEDAGDEKAEAPRRRRPRRAEESDRSDEDERPSRAKQSGSGPAKKTAGRASAAKKAPARKTASAAGRTARAAGRKAGGDTR